jgi:hypothetical protein
VESKIDGSAAIEAVATPVAEGKKNPSAILSSVSPYQPLIKSTPRAGKETGLAFIAMTGSRQLAVQAGNRFGCISSPDASLSIQDVPR